MTNPLMTARQEQLTGILEHIAAVTQGRSASSVLFLTGEAGIGKSTLLRAAQEECRKQHAGARMIIVECSTPLAGRDIGEVESLQPWIEVMNQLVETDAHHGASTKKLITELALAWVKHVPVVGQALEFSVDTAKIIKEHRDKLAEAPPQFAANQQQMFQQCINVLETIIKTQPLVIVLDDAHWADASSLNLLFAAARQLQGNAIAFIVAYRLDDAESARDGAGHPVVHVRNELARYGLCAELGVPRLTATDLDAMLRSRYPRYARNIAFESWLATSSGGNALFVSQYLLNLEHDGLIAAETGEVRDGFEHLPIPDTAFAVVQERLRRLSEDARELLRYASVEGEIFTTDIVSKLTEISVLKLLQRLRAIADQQRVIESMGKQRVYVGETTAYRYIHTLLHRALYESLETEERELLHRAVLENLQEQWKSAVLERIGRAGLAARIAAHAEVLGDLFTAAQALFDGAEASWEEFAEAETRMQLDRAETLLTTIPNATRDERCIALHGKILMARADVDRLHARYDDALKNIRAVREMINPVHDTTLTAQNWSREADVLRLQGDYAASEKAAATGLALLADAPTSKEKILLTIDIGNAHFFCGQYPDAEHWYAAAMVLAREIDHRMGILKVLCNMGYLKARSGELDESMRLLREAIATPEIARNRLLEATLFLNLGLVQTLRGECDDAIRSQERAKELYVSIGDIPGEVKALNNIAHAFMQQGNDESAAPLLQEALALAATVESHEVERIVLANLIDLDLHRARYDDVITWSLRVLPLLEAVADHPRTTSVLETIGACYARLGDIARARDFFERAISLGSQHGLTDYVEETQKELDSLNAAQY